MSLKSTRWIRLKSMPIGLKSSIIEYPFIIGIMAPRAIVKVLHHLKFITSQ